MGEEKALNVGPSGIEMVYERFGDTGSPPVLLVHGGGAQMINWPDGFCAELVGRGVQLIRFDNRDTGLSSHFPDAPVADLQAALAGDFSSARQGVAVLASGDRTERLRSLRVPTLVLHGADDVMCDVSGGRATAAAVPGAKLVIIDGWGHNFPEQLWSKLTSHITELVHHTEAITATT